jgi:hypothetical protein
MIGQTLDDRYAILRLIGQGGMGAVYEARHTGTNRRVAVKVILDAAMDSEQVARFQREAGIVGSIESQHITVVYDTGRDRVTGAPYIAMELLDGEDAEVLLERLGPLPIDLALRIAYQACIGLGRAHQAGVVHRDIKTANLFLHRTEVGHRIVKILDFGIAKQTAGEAINPSLTRTGTILGSPLYMSPEQAKGGKCDARSDVWSLGITLYEMLCGVRPNEDVQQLGELIVTICTQPIARIEQKAPRVPPEVAAVVHRALTIDASARFSSAIEMGEALRALIPGGHVIEESMLRPASAAELSARALPGSFAASGAGMVAPNAPGPNAFGASGAPVLAQSAAAHAQSGTVSGLALGASGTLAPSAPPKAPSRGPLVAGGVVVLAALGLGALWLGQKPSGSAEGAPSAVETSAAKAAGSGPVAVEISSAAPSAPLVVPASSAAPSTSVAVVNAPPPAVTAAVKAPVNAATGALAGALPKPTPSTKPPVKKAATDDESSRK